MASTEPSIARTGLHDGHSCYLPRQTFCWWIKYCK